MLISRVSWRNWVLFTGITFLGFWGTSLLEDTLVGTGGHAFFGLSLLFLLGIHLALVENIIFKVRDWFFMMTLGVFNALFIVPVFGLIIFSFVQNVSESGIVLANMVLTMVLLVIQYKYRHEIVTL